MDKRCEGCRESHCEACPVAFMTESGEEVHTKCDDCLNEDPEECLWCVNNK